MLGAAQTAPIIMSDEPMFAIVDTTGNALRFDRFAYERSLESARGDWHDANWVRCRITLNVSRATKQSVDAELLTTEIVELSNILRATLSSFGAEQTFEPTEPYIKLRIARRDTHVNIGARLDLAPAVGPVIEFVFECRPEEIGATLDAIGRVHEAFPERLTQSGT